MNDHNNECVYVCVCAWIIGKAQAVRRRGRQYVCMCTSSKDLLADGLDTCSKTNGMELNACMHVR